MLLKNLLVTFVTSVEAQVTRRSAVSMGAVLTAIVTVSMLIAIASPALGSYTRCRISDNCSSWLIVDYCGGGPCFIEERWCQVMYCLDCPPPDDDCYFTSDPFYRTCCPGMGCVDDCTNCSGNCN